MIAAHGSEFKLIIFDEVHHLPAPNWGEVALMSPAPFRLGLTATYPTEEEQRGGRWQVDDLIGAIVYEQRIDDLVGARLAEYRTERIRVDLTEAERARYEADFAVYAGYFRAHELPKTHGRYWLQELMRRGAFDPDARAALLARQRLIRLLALAESKLATLEALLKEYADAQSLIFTESNEAVYLIARRHLIPALTHENSRRRAQAYSRWLSGKRLSRHCHLEGAQRRRRCTGSQSRHRPRCYVERPRIHSAIRAGAA